MNNFAGSLDFCELRVQAKSIRIDASRKDA